MSAVKREETPPSTTRWSKLALTVVTYAGRTSPSTTHGFCLIAPIATIATSPGLRIGVPVSIPNEPRLVTVIVPPAMSAGVDLPSRAVIVSSSSAWASCSRLRSWASDVK